MNKSKVVSDNQILIVREEMQHCEEVTHSIPESIRNFKRISDHEISFTTNTAPNVTKNLVFSRERGAEIIMGDKKITVSKKAIQKLCSFNKDVALLREVALGEDYQVGLVDEIKAKFSSSPSELTM